MSLLDAFGLNQTFVRHRKTAAGGFDGGFTESDSAAIPCMAQVESARERYLQQRESDSVTMTLYCAGDADVIGGDEITYDGNRWRVLGVSDPLQDGDHLEVAIELEE